MSNLLLALLAYFIDRIFGEFSFITHPVIYIGRIISWFETNYYQDTIFRGVLLLLFSTTITLILSLLATSILLLLPSLLSTILMALFASAFIAHRMLYDAVLEVTTDPNPKQKLQMLVSRDTADLSESDINKAAIETYAENLSDGVIAPLFYLLLFGLPGIIFYKTVNTLDSMVGYKSARYEHFGKASARLDDLLNYIPARITALFIMVLTQTKPYLSFYTQGALHESPNAGHPITAMALALNVKLGGDTCYFGRVKKKAYFGKGRLNITKSDVTKALALRPRIDLLILASLAALMLL